MRTIIFFILICSFSLCNISFSQNITNTLGTNGVLTIKNGATNYFTVTQSTGQVNILKTLRLEYSTGSGVGVIYKNTERFLYDYWGNTFLGASSGNFTMTGSQNTIIGAYSFSSNTTGFNNTALGMQSLYLNTTGYNNTTLGFNTLFFNGIGRRNTAIGTSALYTNNSGNFNTGVGDSALYNNTSGAWNTALGQGSLSSNIYGNFNTALGYQSGNILQTGSNITCLGSNSQPSSYAASNQVTLGDGGVVSLRCNVQTITSLSDRRDKRNIRDLPVGLDFISKLKPRLFNWDRREWYEDNISNGSKMKETPTAGFIAQELDETQTSENAEWLNLVLKDNPDKWEATYGNLLPVMVKAIQELKTENDGLKTENNELKERLMKLEQMQNVLAVEIEKIKSKKSEAKEIKLGEK